jgi:ketosteroid isomerase-like protein
MNDKAVVETFFNSLWTDPELARSLATEDVTWITTRSMPIPGNEGSIEHVGFDACLNVANSGKEHQNGYLPETITYPNQRYLSAEDDHVVYQFTMQCKTKGGVDYINDYLFLVKLEDGKVSRFQEYWDSKQAFDLLFETAEAVQ